MKRPVERTGIASKLSFDLWSAAVNWNGRFLLLNRFLHLVSGLELAPETRCCRLAVRALLVLLLAFVARVRQQRWVACRAHGASFPGARRACWAKHISCLWIGLASLTHKWRSTGRALFLVSNSWLSWKSFENFIDFNSRFLYFLWLCWAEFRKIYISFISLRFPSIYEWIKFILQIVTFSDPAVKQVW